MHYLDHAATTPVPRAVAEVMFEVMTEGYGNPSAQYGFGREARALVDESRIVIAKALGSKPEQVIFTSCGTEGDNWAIRAALYQNRRIGKHIVTTAVEHSAVLQCCKELEQEGYSVTYLKPDRDGRIEAEQVALAVREDTALVSVMLVNNETGVYYPVKEIAGLLKERATLLHTDAVQGFLKIPFTVKELGADYVTISAHKIGGPKGIGAQYIGGKAKNVRPIFWGGGQENGMRPGTEATAQIAGFGKAVTVRLSAGEEAEQHLRECKAYAKERLGGIEGIAFIGAGEAPHILCISLPGYPSQNIVNELGEKGICVSAGSACHRGKASHVLTAMGIEKRTAAGAIRVSFGPETSLQDIDALAEALSEHQKRRFPML